MYTVKRMIGSITAKSFEEMVNLYKAGKIADDEQVIDDVMGSTMTVRELLGPHADPERRAKYRQEENTETIIARKEEASEKSNLEDLFRKAEQVREKKAEKPSAASPIPKPRMPRPSIPPKPSEETETKPLSWWHGTFMIIIALAISPPIGLLLLWTRPRVGLFGNPVIKIILTVMIVSSFLQEMDPEFGVQDIAPAIEGWLQHLMDKLGG